MSRPGPPRAAPPPDPGGHERGELRLQRAAGDGGLRAPGGAGPPRARAAPAGPAGAGNRGRPPPGTAALRSGKAARSRPPRGSRPRPERPRTAPGARRPAGPGGHPGRSAPGAPPAVSRPCGSHPAGGQGHGPGEVAGESSARARWPGRESSARSAVGAETLRSPNVRGRAWEGKKPPTNQIA